MGDVTEEQAARLIEELICEMHDRRGFRETWDQIDPEMARQIRAAWVAVVLQQLGPELFADHPAVTAR